MQLTLFVLLLIVAIIITVYIISRQKEGLSTIRSGIFTGSPNYPFWMNEPPDNPRFLPPSNTENCSTIGSTTNPPLINDYYYTGEFPSNNDVPVRYILDESPFGESLTQYGGWSVPVMASGIGMSLKPV